MRALAGLFLALLLTPATASDAITCTSLDGAQSVSIFLSFKEGSDEGTIEKVEIPSPDVLWTTETVDGIPGLLLADTAVDFDTIDIFLENPVTVRGIASLQISRALAFKHPDNPENEEHWSAVGGTLDIQGRGAWVVTCEGWRD